MEQLANLLHVGNLQGCISKGESMTQLDAGQKTERDVLVYRCFILQNRAQIVVDEVPPDAGSSLGAVRLLARAVLGERVEEELRVLQGSASAYSNPVLALVGALVHERQAAGAAGVEEALRWAAHGAKLGSAECRALLAQLFVRHCRQSEAEQQLRLLQQQHDEDSPLTVLCAARVALASGSAARCAESAAALEELAERLGGATPAVAALAAQCHLAAAHAEEAEAGLREALARDPAHAAALCSLSALLAHQGPAKAQQAARALAQARTTPHGAKSLQFLADAENAFDKAAAVEQ